MGLISDVDVAAAAAADVAVVSLDDDIAAVAIGSAAVIGVAEVAVDGLSAGIAADATNDALPDKGSAPVVTLKLSLFSLSALTASL